jgi:hypothetical protein
MARIVPLGMSLATTVSGYIVQAGYFLVVAFLDTGPKRLPVLGSTSTGFRRTPAITDVVVSVVSSIYGSL